MSTQIQFGDKWVQVKGSIFYLTPSAMESLRAWYDWSVNHDTEASEESRAEEVEYFAKAFEMLKPHMRRMNLKYRISPIKILTPLFKANFPGIVMSKMFSRTMAYIRLKEEDKALLMKIAEYYDVSESDAVKIAMKHLAKELGLLSS
jgi:replication initiation and membrane attachment protein DnaB